MIFLFNLKLLLFLISAFLCYPHTPRHFSSTYYFSLILNPNLKNHPTLPSSRSTPQSTELTLLTRHIPRWIHINLSPIKATRLTKVILHVVLLPPHVIPAETPRSVIFTWDGISSAVALVLVSVAFVDRK
jgi:hypothetical protein